LKDRPSDMNSIPPGELSLFACCKKSLKVSLIVGTILSAINQGGVIWDHTFSTRDLIRIILNYLIPLAVATYARLALIKELE